VVNAHLRHNEDPANAGGHGHVVGGAELLRDGTEDLAVDDGVDLVGARVHVRLDEPAHAFLCFTQAQDYRVWIVITRLIAGKDDAWCE
jgi:hypothetical protein